MSNEQIGAQNHCLKALAVSAVTQGKAQVHCSPQWVIDLCDGYAALEAERAEQWRLRRDAEADRDTKSAVIAELRAELLALKARMAEPVAWARRADLDDPSDCLFVSRYQYLATDYSVALYTAAPPAAQDVSGLVEALHSMTCAYRSAIQAGYDRITALGGDCDSVQLMLNNYPDYRKAVALIAAHRQAQQQDS